MKVKVVYSPDLKEIGTVKEVPDDEARGLIREGRVVPYDEADDEPLGEQETSEVKVYGATQPVRTLRTTRNEPDNGQGATGKEESAGEEEPPPREAAVSNPPAQPAVDADVPHDSATDSAPRAARRSRR